MAVSNLQLKIQSENPAIGPVHKVLQNGNILNGRFSQLTEKYFFCQFVAIFQGLNVKGCSDASQTHNTLVKTMSLHKFDVNSSHNLEKDFNKTLFISHNSWWPTRN
jgi:hypothetical protein